MKTRYIRPARHKEPWNATEVGWLTWRWGTGWTVQQLMDAHGRSHRAICMRLESLFGSGWMTYNIPLHRKVTDLEKKLAAMQANKFRSTPGDGSRLS